MAIAPNFSFEGDPRMYSRDDGSFYYDPVTLIMMQTTRNIVNHALWVNSWYRSPLLNAITRGASPVSEHLVGRAVDISTVGYDRERIYRAGIEAGFTSMGFYNTFIHFGRSGKRWFGSHQSKLIWAPILGIQVDAKL